MSKKEILFVPVKSEPDIEYLSADNNNSKITDGLKYNESKIKLENDDEILHIKQEDIDIKDEIQTIDDNQDVESVTLSHPIQNYANSKRPNQKLNQPEKLFACALCEFKAISKSQLSSHTRIHPEKLLDCNLCEYKTTQKYMLTRHIRTHTGEKPFKCIVCKYKFSRKDSLLIHESTHTGVAPFACDICEFKTFWKKNLTIHKRVHKGKKPFACCICGLKFSDKNDLLIHKSRHIEEFPCSICDFKSSQKIHLIVHMRNHNQEKLLSCNLCTFETTEKLHLTTHMSMHKEEKLPVSNLNKFTITSNSNASLKSHADKKYQVASEELFACQLCDFKTTAKLHLTTHMSMHKEETIPISNLNKFTITSDSNAPLTSQADKYQIASTVLYACHLCEFKTTIKNYLMCHREIHKFVCNLCKFQTTEKSYLEKHVKAHFR